MCYKRANEDTHNDVVHVVFLDPRSQININLDPVPSILLLDCVQERVEPLGATKVTDDPSKVDLLHRNRKRGRGKKTVDVISSPAVTVRGRLTFERRVGFESFKLFIRYQMDFRILMTAQEEKKAGKKHIDAQPEK